MRDYVDRRVTHQINLFVNVKLLSAEENVPNLIKFFLQKCGVYLRAALKTIVIPLSTVFT